MFDTKISSQRSCVISVELFHCNMCIRVSTGTKKRHISYSNKEKKIYVDRMDLLDYGKNKKDT